MSSLYLKYSYLQFSPSCFTTICQTTNYIHSLLYSDLSESSFNDKFKKAKLISGLTQIELSKLTGLSRSTINELERGSRDNISRDTLLKLIKILDKNILCDDYLLFILNQEENITNLLNKYGVGKLCAILECHHSSIYRWKVFKCQFPRSKYNIIKKLDQDN